MNSAARILLPIGVLAAAVVGLVLFSGDDSTEMAPLPGRNDPGEQHQPENGGSDPITAKIEDPQQQNTGTRTEVETGVVNAAADAAQGVMGRVLKPGGSPAGDVEVFLLKSAGGSNTFEIFLANKQGRAIPPVARTVTDDEGEFRLGVEKLSEDPFDLRVVSMNFPDLHHANIRIKKDEWYDTKDLWLEQGIVVQGRVLEEGSNLPVTNATVFMRSTNATHTLLPTPGREHGVAVPVDGGGSFRFFNAPTSGTISLAAESPDYARVERLNLQISREQVNDFEILLPRGMPIGGTVVNAQGQPVSGAEVVATALSSKTPQTGKTVTASDGRFVIPGLRDGPYQVLVTSKEYEDRAEKPVMAGKTDLTLTLEARASVRVKVLAASGAQVMNYHLSLKRHFPENPLGIGNVMEFPDRRIGPGDHDSQGFVTIAGIPVTGQFLWQVRDDNHAKTLSDPFQATPGGPPPEVVVTLVQGGLIRGRVLNDRGEPVGGALVRTEISGGFALDTEFGKLFAQFMPDKITKADTRTDSQGRFELRRLAYGDYELRASHKDYCEATSEKITITGDQTMEVGDLYLTRGTLITGRATFNGVPSGQIKIQINPPQGTQPELDPEGQVKSWFTAHGFSNSQGIYTISKRVPPGNYEIHASMQSGDNNPFVIFGDMNQTKRALTVVPGQEHLEVNFNIAR